MAASVAYLSVGYSRLPRRIAVFRPQKGCEYFVAMQK